MVLSLLLFEKTYLPFTGAIIPFWVILVSALSGSASFANPAISVANSLSHTVTSEPTSALLGLLASQLLGGIVGYAIAWFFKLRHEPAPATFSRR
jgi:glycerol uptake facilitator-like aquaporin